jgi:phage tail-like protein
MPSIDTNIGVTIATRLPGLRLDPYQSNNFVIEIEGLLVGGFSDCSGLQVEVEALEYREGGQNDFLHRFAGATRHPPLVLKHGISPMDGLWGWHQDVVSGVITRRNGTIYLLNQAQIPVTWWNFRDGLPLKWNGPDLKADAASVAFESVEIVHRGLVRAKKSTAETAVSIAASELANAVNNAGGFF